MDILLTVFQYVIAGGAIFFAAGVVLKMVKSIFE